MSMLPTGKGLAALRYYVSAAERPSEVRSRVTAAPLAVQREYGAAVMLWAVDGPRGSVGQDAAALADILTEASRAVVDG